MSLKYYIESIKQLNMSFKIESLNHIYTEYVFFRDHKAVKINKMFQKTKCFFLV